MAQRRGSEVVGPVGAMVMPVTVMAAPGEGRIFDWTSPTKILALSRVTGGRVIMVPVTRALEALVLGKVAVTVAVGVWVIARMGEVYEIRLSWNPVEHGEEWVAWRSLPKEELLMVWEPRSWPVQPYLRRC